MADRPVQDPRMTRPSRHLVDPELLELVDAWPTVSLTHETLADLRGRDLPLPEASAEALADVELLMRAAPGRDGAPDVPVRVYRPRGARGPLPCIFHIHGGGYVGGSTAELEAVHRERVLDLGCVLVTCDYRLAPETPHPGPVEDCYAALAWTVAEAAALGVDPARLGVMGESAGGGLAAALALLARDRGEYALAFQHLIYPMLDDRTAAGEDHPYAGEYIWTPHNNRFGWACLLGHEPGRDEVSPYAAAARAQDLGGLPPTFISTGALDLFIDEDLVYAQRLIHAGVPTELHVYAGGYHGYDLAPEARVSRAARAASRAALQRALFG
jgi:acetyl esterase/lipase